MHVPDLAVAFAGDDDWGVHRSLGDVELCVYVVPEWCGHRVRAEVDRSRTFYDFV